MQFQFSNITETMSLAQQFLQKRLSQTFGILEVWFCTTAQIPRFRNMLPGGKGPHPRNETSFQMKYPLCPPVPLSFALSPLYLSGIKFMSLFK